jgi:DNA-binding NarL/FixJ family response regulator
MVTAHGRSPEKTVSSHVSNVLNKLGFSSRAQIAGWFSALSASD